MPALGPPPGLGLVKAMDSAFLTEANTYWSRTAQVLEESFKSVSQGLAQPDGTDWRGVVAHKAQARGHEDLIKVRGAANQLHDAAAIARRGASQSEAARQQVLDAVEAAHADGFDVADDYTGTDQWTGGSDDFQAARHALAVEHADFIWHRVTALAVTDREIAVQIAAATDGVKTFSFDELPADKPPDDEPADGPVGRHPGEVSGQ